MVDTPKQKKIEISNFKNSGIDRFITPEGLEAFTSAYEIFANHQHTRENNQNDPTIAIEIRKKAHIYIEKVVTEIIQKIQSDFISLGQVVTLAKRKNKKGRVKKKQRIEGKGVLKIDYLMFLTKFLESLYKIFPKFYTFEYCSENYLLNEIAGRIQGFLLTIIALKENQHRQANQGKTHEIFFRLADEKNIPVNAPPSVKIFYTIHLEKYLFIKNTIIPFLRRNDFQKEKPGSQEKWDLESLKETNDKIFAMIQNHQAYSVPFCLVEETDLIKDKSFALQVAPLEKEVGTFYHDFAQIGYYDEQTGNMLKTTPEIQKKLLIKREDDKINLAPVIVGEEGGLPSLQISRLTGDLSFFDMGKECLVLIDPLHYELIRHDILWNLAQMLCKCNILENLYGDFFQTNRGSNTEKREPKKEKDKKTPPNNLFFPKGQNNEGIDKLNRILSLRSLPEQETETKETEPQKEQIPLNENEKQIKGGHKRLLPLRKKVYWDSVSGEKNIRYTALKPSTEAIQKAKVTGIKMEEGVEFVEIENGVFYPEDLPQVLAEMELDNLDEFIEYFRDKGFKVYKRYETWSGSIDEFARSARIAKVKMRSFLDALPE